MRAINHALTGALIGFAVGEPVVAVPAALASHFVLDAIPHHATKSQSLKVLRSKLFKISLIIDAALCFMLVALLAGRHPAHWLTAAVCAFVAASPDFLFVPRYLSALRRKPWRPGAFVKWTRDIQWFQRPIGAAVEISWFIAAVVLLAPFLR
jgi:hypothetical protein